MSNLHLWQLFLALKLKKKIEKEVKMSRLSCFLDHTKHFQLAFKKRIDLKGTPVISHVRYINILTQQNCQFFTFVLSLNSQKRFG